MKTQNNKLGLVKKDVLELNNVSLKQVNGGWSTRFPNFTDIFNYSKDTFCNSDQK